MPSPVHFSLMVDAELPASLRTAAAWRGMSVEACARSAIQAAAQADANLAAFVQDGIDSADRGELIGQDQLEAWFELRHRPAAAE